MPHTLYSYVVIVAVLVMCVTIVSVRIKMWKRLVLCTMLAISSLSVYRAVNSFSYVGANRFECTSNFYSS